MQNVRVASRSAAPPADVFDAWLDVEIARRWLFATASHQVARLDIDARIGGRFRALDVRDGSSIEYAGRYQEILRPHRLVFTLTLPESMGVDTRVSVTIAGLRSGSSIALLHQQVPPPSAEAMKMRWTGMLYGLGLLLDAKMRHRKLFNAHCRFERLPIDYVTNRLRFTTIRSDS